jgi:hypothetical protein
MTRNKTVTWVTLALTDGCTPPPYPDYFMCLTNLSLPYPAVPGTA